MKQAVTSAFLYPEFLIAESEGLPKGERTRARIMKAACELLDECGPQDLRVTDICARTGISNGTFYIYFADRGRLVEELLEKFVGHLQSTMRGVSRDAPDPMRAATEAYYEQFRLNRGLMRCLIHHMDSFPGPRRAFHSLNREWVETVVASAQARLKREGRADALPADELRRRAYALGYMVDQYLSSLFLSEDPNLTAVSGDGGAVVDTLTLIWKRGMAL